MKRELPKNCVFDPKRAFEKDPDLELPKRDPEKDDLPKVEPPKRELPKLFPPRTVAEDEPLAGPKECHPLPTPPPLCAEKFEPAKFPELRPPLKREEPPPLPNECQFPSPIAE